MEEWRRKYILDRKIIKDRKSWKKGEGSETDPKRKKKQES